MGQLDVKGTDEESLRAFTRHLLQDVRALDYMLTNERFETGIRRIGAEQELFLVDKRWQPAPIIEQVLEHTSDPRIVTELTRFNLEFNLDPVEFGGKCLSELEEQLNEMLDTVRGLVAKEDGHVVLTGILPTVHLSELTLDYMTPKKRYYALNDAITRLRGGPAQFQLRGMDELFVKHDTIMLEGVNTSFQTHFQVDPEEFPRFYNFAQAVAAPCLAVATNSPVLFGKRLWKETRIALFQQAVDTRSSNLYLREMSPRVHFGSEWVKESVLELFKEDIARFRVLLTTDLDESPFQVLQEGGVPKLQALQLHNGTVYRWNRACYGILNGKPHLRIENRILPSGPTTVDEVANAAFWYGLVSGMASEFGDISKVMDFDDAKNNFMAAARYGLGAQFTWVDGKQIPARELILEHLLPVARHGLSISGIDEEDIDRYLNIIENRARSRQTGADWQLKSLAQMKQHGTRAERLAALVATMVERQKEGKPVHEWELATMEEFGGAGQVRNARVEHFMSTDLFTVHEEEPVEFVASLLDWRRIRQVIVEDHNHRLVGVVSHRDLLRFLANRSEDEGQVTVPVRDVMMSDPVSVSPETPALEAIEVMRESQSGALPVVRDDHLVGIITERDFIRVTGQLLDNHYTPPAEGATSPGDENSGEA